MALVNDQKKAINVKLVCFGPPASGKQSSLEQLYRTLGADCRGKLKSMAVQKDRMLFFDYSPPGLASLGPYSLRFHLYTVPDVVASQSVWKLVMKGADGILFVADSTRVRQEENAAWLRVLEEIVPEEDLADIPMVFLYSKRDLPDAVAVDEMQRHLNVMNAPAFPAIATEGKGVSAAFSILSEMVVSRLRRTLPGLDEEIPPAAEPAVEPLAPAPADVAVEAGEPTLSVGGEIRLPLRIAFPGGEKRLVLTVMLDEEER